MINDSVAQMLGLYDEVDNKIPDRVLDSKIFKFNLEEDESLN